MIEWNGRRVKLGRVFCFVFGGLLASHGAIALYYEADKAAKHRSTRTELHNKFLTIELLKIENDRLRSRVDQTQATLEKQKQAQEQATQELVLLKSCSISSPLLPPPYQTFFSSVVLSSDDLRLRPRLLSATDDSPPSDHLFYSPRYVQSWPESLLQPEYSSYVFSRTNQVPIPQFVFRNWSRMSPDGVDVDD